MIPADKSQAFAAGTHTTLRNRMRPNATKRIIEEADEFLMPVARHALADDPAQPGLGAVERLDLQLLLSSRQIRISATPLKSFISASNLSYGKLGVNHNKVRN